MAYRGITDPFTPKTTRNERFAQMSKQEQLIEQKKREIQAKLEEQKKKETDEALKKFQGSTGNSKSGPGSRNNASGHRGPRKSFWKSHDQRWKKETAHFEDTAHSQKTGSVNIFSNDGSFLDQFKKLSGVKEPKNKRDDDASAAINKSDLKSPTSSSLENHRKRDPDSDWGTWGSAAEKRVPEPVGRDYNDRERRSGCGEREQEHDKEEELQNSDRLGTSHWFQSPHSQDDLGSWQGQAISPPHVSNRPSSPYSPTRATGDALAKIPETCSTPILSNQARFQSAPLHNPSSIPPLITPPPPILPQLSLQSYLQYSAPPPLLHSIPPIQPHSIPTLPATSISTPLSIPSLMQHSISTDMVDPTPSLAQGIASRLLHPSPLVQHAVPPAPILTRPLGPVTISHSILPPPPSTPILPLPSTPNATVILQPRVTPLMATPVIPPLMGLPILPPVLPLSGLGPASARLSTPIGTGVSSAAPAPEPVGEEATTHLALMVAQCGDDIEQIIRARNPDDSTLWFLHDKESAAYIQYRCLVDKFCSEIKKEEKERDEDKVEEENCDTSLRSDDVKQEPDVGNIKNEKDVSTEYRGVQQEQSGEQDEERGIKHEVKQEQLEDDNSRQSEGKRSGDESDEARKRKRRSRWAPEDIKVDMGAVGMAISPTAEPVKVVPVSGCSQLLSKITPTDPALIQYAIQAFGSSNLSEEDWKKAQDHYKINLLYQDMLRKRQELDRLTRAGKFKYEYDSDEETDGGTWEHRLRSAEMEATQLWADELTKKAAGKHHIGDFLPPDELERFLEKYNALKEGREPDLSDYKEFKLKEDNIGFQMLQKLGWTEGQGLGSEGLGITDPVNKASTRPENQGLGLERPDDVSRGDDEYDAYRKRMMLAYRFRPNPLNNPRRPYY